MKYKALIVEEENNEAILDYVESMFETLAEDEVRVKVAYSGINYKDRLAVDPASKVVRQYPMVPGIDFSGTVMESNSKEFKVGDRVFLTGRGYGTDRPGGFQEYADVSDKDLCLLPEGLSLRDVMLYGTAGFTAALSVDALLKERDVSGKVILVTGGAGGVSSHAVMILNRLGAHVTVATRNPENTDYLKELGAEEVILFDALLEKRKALSREKWDGVIDTTGGEALGNLLTEIKYGGVIAASGNLSGIKFSATVFPFILRGITLKGIESVYADKDLKNILFSKLSDEWKAEKLMNTMHKEIRFSELKNELLEPSKGKGRIVVAFI